jgi:hypothetical protein
MNASLLKSALKNNYRNIFLTFLIFQMVLFSSCVTYKKSDFAEIEPQIHFMSEPYNNSVHSSMNSSPYEFSVENDKGSLCIGKSNFFMFNMFNNNATSYDLPNGTLVGYDRGEFGGSLEFFQDNKSKYITIMSGVCVKKIFEYHNKLYFVDGLAHMDYSGGSMYRIDTTNDSIKCTKVLDIDDSPEAIAIYNDKIYMATDAGFFVLNDYFLNSMSMKRYFKDAFWYALYPNSVAVLDDSNVYLGVRGGIVKLNLERKKMKVYKFSQLYWSLRICYFVISKELEFK